jgi:hypothetical protein
MWKCVKPLQPGVDSLLHVGICCKLLAILVLLVVSEEMEVTGPHTAHSTCDWEYVDKPPISLCPVFPIFYGLLRSAWQASSLQWMPACSKFCCAAHIGHIHGQVRLPEEGIDALWQYFVHTYHPHTDLNFLKIRLNIIPPPMLSPYVLHSPTTSFFLI